MRRYRRGRSERTANQIIQKGGKALGLACDVTRREQVDAMIQRAIEEFGSVEFQFNSAVRPVAGPRFLISMTSYGIKLSI